MSSSDRRVIALGNLAGELKTSLEAAARTVGVELLLTREPARAFVELERDGALAVLVDMATLGAEQFCKRARGTERLRTVPVVGMSRHPNELGFARVFAWGADDLVPLGARLPLERRLQVLKDTPKPDRSGFGQAVVAEATTQRRALVGRVLSQAGYDVKFAVDRSAVELYASQSETRLVIISAALGDPRRIIDAAARAGALPTWIITVEARSTARLAASLAGLDRVAVTSTTGSPEDVLFLANELVFSKGRRREWRALYATPVAFRAKDGEVDEYGFSYDASPSGLYVRSLLPPASDEVEIELRLPNRDERVRLSGKVAKRFAFGSAAIASAPPGFGVKFEGPAAALAQWTEACVALIAAASSESLPPRPRSASQPAVPGLELAGKEVALAVPATVSIESVVAPLPVEARPQAAEATDVGELLAATLDEQTLAQVGTRPVTIGSDGGVRETSEFGASLPPARPVSSLPPLAVSEPPAPLTPTRPGTPDPPRTLGGTVVMNEPPGGPPPTPHSVDWESDAETAVRASQPANEPSILSELPAADLESDHPPEGSAALAEPEPPRSPDTRQAAFAATVLAGDAPPRRGVTSALLERSESFEAPAAVAPLPAPKQSAPQLVGHKQTLPFGFTKQEPPGNETPRSSPARTETSNPRASKPDASGPEASNPRASRPDQPQRPAVAEKPPHPEPPLAAKRAPAPEPAKASSGYKRFLVLAGASIGATVVGMGLAFVVRHPQAGEREAARQRRAAETAPPVAPRAPSAAALQAAPGVPSPPAAGATEAPAKSVDQPTVAAVPSASGAPSSSAALAVTVAPPEASLPPATSAPAPSTAPPVAPVAQPLPEVPKATFDVNRLPPDRAALIVHSSAATHVFVHGVDYGETNQVLMTSCGTRFVRLGRALGDFIEPGAAHVLKCRRLTELTIEPPH